MSELRVSQAALEILRRVGVEELRVSHAPVEIMHRANIGAGQVRVSQTPIEIMYLLYDVPGAPTNLTASAISSVAIALNWTSPAPPTGAGAYAETRARAYPRTHGREEGPPAGPTIFGYRIERKIDAGMFEILVDHTLSQDTSYEDRGLTPGSTYTYRVSAINAAGVGAASNEDFVTLVSVDETARVTQVPIEILHKDATAVAQVTQVPLEILYTARDTSPIPGRMGPALKSLLQTCAHHHTTLWKIERVDGVSLHFTDHDCDITFECNIYTPAGGFNASARDRQTGLRTQNLEILGALTSDAITFDDLRARRYHEAKVTEFTVDHRFPWIGYFQKHVYWINETQFSGEDWVAQMSGITRWLRQSIGRVVTRNCNQTLGEGICGQGVNIEDFTEHNVQVTAVSGATPRLEFTANSLAGFDPGWFALGNVVWTSGANNGISMEVRSSSASGVIELVMEMPFDIEVGDVFSISAGCDKTLTTCEEKFNNVVNHKGYPHVPGPDSVFQIHSKESQVS